MGTVEDFAKERGKIFFPDENSIEKMEDLNKVEQKLDLKYNFTCHICQTNTIADKDQLVEHVIAVHGDFNKVEQMLELKSDFMCHICQENGMANKDQLVEHVITEHGDEPTFTKNEERPPIKIVDKILDESSNDSLRLFLSDGEDDYSED